MNQEKDSVPRPYCLQPQWTAHHRERIRSYYGRGELNSKIFNKTLMWAFIITIVHTTQNNCWNKVKPDHHFELKTLSVLLKKNEFVFTFEFLQRMSWARQLQTFYVMRNVFFVDYYHHGWLFEQIEFLNILIHYLEFIVRIWMCKSEVDSHMG